MSLSSALVEDDWLKPLVEDLGLSGDDYLKWDDLAFLDLATPQSKSKVHPDLFFDSTGLFDGDYFEKGAAGALLDLFPSSSTHAEEGAEKLLEDLIEPSPATQPPPLVVPPLVSSVHDTASNEPASTLPEQPPPVVTSVAKGTDEAGGRITLGGIKTLPVDSIPKDALAKISIQRNAREKTTTISVLTPDGTSGNSYQVNTLNVLEAIEALKPLNLDKLIFSQTKLHKTMPPPPSTIQQHQQQQMSSLLLSSSSFSSSRQFSKSTTKKDSDRIELHVNESESSSVLVEKVQDSSTAAFIKHFHYRGISINALFRIKSSPRYWICPTQDCKKGFSKPSLLKVHLYEHYGIRPFECPIPGCKWSFKTPFKLKRHQRTHNTKDSLCKKRFICNYCNAGFNTARNLGVHLKSHVSSFSSSLTTLLTERQDDHFLYDL
uniref:Zinc finger X-linked protein ZXDA/ZXDB n=1 Tax=Lepeophtheirus salmonis TaxID=72036 RepID=D3PFL4_LEPSM|nr:Zinc finger X-linked protein ZXDA/ZXDB [Lepeophtheirus salmonis]